MVLAKVIRLKPEIKYKNPRRSGNVKDSLSSIATIPDAITPIERLMARDLPKAYPTLVFLANRNKEGLSPRDWYAQMCEALGIEPKDLEDPPWHASI